MGVLVPISRAPIHVNGGRRHVILLGALPDPGLVSVIGTDGAVGGAKVDTDVVLHDPTFLSVTVPVLMTPSGPMMIGSSI